MRNLTAQSAIEYLMTYGWAILIIAVALGALFGLGFFNSANLAPKVAAGSCQVYRPNGPGTTTFINLEGTCNNELPQYVAQFNGQSSYIETPSSGSLTLTNTGSAFAWVYISSYHGNQRIVNFGNNLAWELYLNGGNKLSVFGFSGAPNSNFILNANEWYFVGISVAPGTITYYVNSQTQIVSYGTAISTNGLPLYLGTDTVSSDIFNGLISNAQIYNTSLSANEVAALYDEGMGGDPININYLAGWWPLNGNANDYSGNLNNGVPTSVVFTSSWTSGYTAP